MTKRVYCIHGEPLVVTSASSALVRAADELLTSFDGLPGAHADRAPLAMVLHAVASLADLPEGVPPSAERISAWEGPGEGYTLYRSAGRWLVDFHGYGLLRLDPAAGSVEGWLVEPEAMHPDLPAALVRLSVLELLRLRGLYAIHAAALEKDGRGILIAGACGQGKTTSCLSLVRGGYRCLSDDHPLLRRSPAGLELLPFLSGMNVTERTISFFPELRAAQDGFRRRLDKRTFHLDEVFGPRRPAACRPSFLIFPRVVDWPESYLEPLSRARALEELLPESLLVLDYDLAVQQFQALAELVQSVACYRLHFGEDVLGLPRVFDRLLQPVGLRGAA